jgi:hypothetical protein
MKEIINSNIQCISPDGKEYFTHFHWLREFIWRLKHEVKEVEVDVVIKNALNHFPDDKYITNPITKELSIIRTNNDTSWNINKGKYKVKQIVPGRTILNYGYFLRLKEELELGREVTIKNWKFKVI